MKGSKINLLKSLEMVKKCTLIVAGMLNQQNRVYSKQLQIHLVFSRNTRRKIIKVSFNLFLVL